MPEVWFPYGDVETLVTIQAENLGTLVEQAPEPPVGTEFFPELLKGQVSLYLCDSFPSTLELLKAAGAGTASADTLRVFSADPKRVEGAVPELKGRVTLAPRASTSSKGQESAHPFAEEGRKVIVATARPDPLFGLVDARVSAALCWVAGALETAAMTRKDFEPTPFEKTASFDSAHEAAGAIHDAAFVTVVPRGGKVWTAMQDAPFDAVRNAFRESPLSPARGLVVGSGGSGYDSTFSGALRSVWGVVSGIRRGGEVLMVSECSAGLGSQALDMFVSGRLTSEGRRKERYIPGLEEVFYLSKLKEEYGVLLLSGLPETFVKGKLGLSSARGSGEAVGRLLNKLGRSAKVNLVTRAPELRISSA